MTLRRPVSLISPRKTPHNHFYFVGFMYSFIDIGGHVFIGMRELFMTHRRLSEREKPTLQITLVYVLFEFFNWSRVTWILWDVSSWECAKYLRRFKGQKIESHTTRPHMYIYIYIYIYIWFRVTWTLVVESSHGSAPNISALGRRWEFKTRETYQTFTWPFHLFSNF